MQRHKSKRHVRAANARWRAAEERAHAERDAGIPDVPVFDDSRRPFLLPLSYFGFRDLWMEPRIGYIGWRAMDPETREVIYCAASKEMLRWLALKVPKMLGAGNFIHGTQRQH